MLNHTFKIFFFLSISTIAVNAFALDANSIQITGLSDMLSNGETLLKFAAKWGGIATVVGAALALGSGKLQGAVANTICKILIVTGLLIAAFSYFGNQINGFAF